jgi:HD-like signal output (HDOD) protein
MQTHRVPSSNGFMSRVLGAMKRLTQRDQHDSAPVHWPTPRMPMPDAPRKDVQVPVARPVVTPTPRVEAAPVAIPTTPQPRVNSEAVETFVAAVRQLPLFSGTAMQLMRSVGQDDVTTTELVRLISTDAGLVAQLLRIVNSPYYGLPKKCSTVNDAVSVLGFDQVRRMISAAVTQRPLAAYLHDTNVVRVFWRHQLMCAAMARHLALQNHLDGEVAYMAGLMHEVGRLAMLIQHPHLTEVLLHVENDDSRLGTEREQAHFGFDHAEAGGALLARWGLPQPIVEAAYDHGDATMPADPMSAVVWRANLLAHDMIDEADEIEVPSPWMQAIGLSAEERRRILDEIRALENG